MLVFTKETSYERYRPFEKQAAAGQNYVRVVCDLDRGTLEKVTEGNNCASLEADFDQLNDEPLPGIEAVSMDMAGGYINAVTGRLLNGCEKIVFDRFHTMKLMNEAVDKVRKQEQRLLRDQGNLVLTDTKFLWIYGQQRLPSQHGDWFASLSAAKLRITLMLFTMAVLTRPQKNHHLLRRARKWPHSRR